MDNPIIKKLFENKAKIDTSVFNAANHSDEAYDLMDIIEMTIRDVRDKLFDDVDMDDSGMNSYGDVKGDRTIVYQCELYHFQFDGNSEPKMIPLNNKEKKSLYNSLINAFPLPEDDGTYSYSSSVSYEGTTLKITLKRES